jgi:glycosyltransferase involved in cell wall biosynthesis
MKILLTVHQFLPHFSTGTEILTFETAKSLQQLGHEVCVLTGFPAREVLSDEKRFDAYAYQGVQVRRFHYSYVPMDGQNNITEAEYKNLFFASHFQIFLERTQPDVVHFFHLQRLSASAVEVCHQMGIPTALTPTDFWFVCPTIQLLLPDGSMCCGPKWNAANCVRHLVELNKPEGIKVQIGKRPDWLLALTIWANQRGTVKSPWFTPEIAALAERHVYLREQLNKIDRVLVPTRLMESVLTANGLAQEKVVFAPYGINLAYLQRSPRPLRGDTLRVGFIGSLNEHKGVHLLVEAIRSLLPGRPLELKIFGQVEDVPAYVARLRELASGDPRIQFCGTFANPIIGEVFSGLDVLVVPSIWYENTPLVIYSAQAAGCPVIASDLGGMAEVIHHEDNGLLFKPGSVAELAQALQRVSEDRDLLERLAKRAIMPRSIRDYVRQIETVYEDIVTGRTEVHTFAAGSH